MTTTSMNPTLIRRCMSDINAEPVEWLWPARFPMKLTLIGGHPGLGKSQITIAIAATVSNGGLWPDGTKSQQGSVIFISSEDDPSDTIKPRLEAAGANTKYVHVIDAVLDEQLKPRSWLLSDFEVIENLVIELGDVRLIVIDPITAYIGGKDGHSTSDVRGLLSPLMDLASRMKFAIIAVSHLNKSSKEEAVTRVTGSLAYVAASRAAYVVGQHPTIDDARCLAPLKNNLGDDKTGFGYRVIDATSTDGFKTSRVEWIPGAIEISADDVLSKRQSSSDDIDADSAKGDAAAFLLNILKNGPVKSVRVHQERELADIAESTFNRAKKKLRIRSEKKSDVWYMSLPDRDQEVQEGAALNLELLDLLDPLEAQACQEVQEVQDLQSGYVEHLADQEGQEGQEGQEFQKGSIDYCEANTGNRGGVL